ncbi:MAG: type II toxin-antitoxin system VapC family toxin [Tagaea sp.]
MSVFDSSAMLAMFYGEPGGDAVARMLDEDTPNVVSTLILAEMLAKYRQRGGAPGALLDKLRGFGIEFEPFGADDDKLTSEIEPLTRPHGLSLADRACLCLGLRRNLPVVTADRVWRNVVSLPLRIVLIR